MEAPPPAAAGCGASAARAGSSTNTHIKNGRCRACNMMSTAVSVSVGATATAEQASCVACSAASAGPVWLSHHLSSSSSIKESVCCVWGVCALLKKTWQRHDRADLAQISSRPPSSSPHCEHHTLSVTLLPSSQPSCKVGGAIGDRGVARGLTRGRADFE